MATRGQLEGEFLHSAGVEFTPQEIVLDLSVARDNVVRNIGGNSIIAFSATDFVSNVDVAVQEQAGKPVNFTQGVKAGFGKNFTRLFISNLAQPGKTLTLKVGGPNLLLLSVQANTSDVSGSSVSITNAPTITGITNPIDVQSIADPVAIGDIADTLETDVVDGAETNNATTAVGAASITLRTVPAGKIELVKVFNNGAAAVFLAVGAAAVAASSFPLPAGASVSFLVSGGVGGLAVNAIAAAGPEDVRAWALPIK